MNLVIPQEIKKSINSYSGYINNPEYSSKNLKGLFLLEINTRYLADELYKLITCKEYIKDNLPEDSIYEPKITGYNNKSTYCSKVDRILKAFINKRKFLQQVINGLIESNPIPFQEDLGVLNPVQQLHKVNLDFLVNTSKSLIQDPQNLVQGFNNINPDTNKSEDDIEYDYTASSYSDGVWKPEDLFINSKRNKQNPYWIPVEINIYSNSKAKGVGHKYNDQLYNKGTKQYSQFPAWQTTVSKRFYEKDNSDGLKDGGCSDRRVQRPHGYDMSALTRK